MIADLTADTAKMRAAAEPGYPTATDLADWVVRVLKKPFREAHHIAGSIVKRAEDNGRHARQAAAGGDAERSSPPSPKECSRCCRWKRR